jgi:DNA-binding MarR family transcriptional regulator
MDNERLLNILVSIKEKCTDTEERIRKSLNLSVAEYRGLICLRPEEKISCQEFSARMNLSVSRGSRVIENLTRKKYLKRVDNTSDRRCKNVWLTERGVRASQRIDSQIQDCEDKLVAGIPQKNLVQFKSDLKTLAAKF